MPCGGAIACAIYFAAYEYLRWRMHLLEQRHAARRAILKILAETKTDLPPEWNTTAQK